MVGGLAVSARSEPRLTRDVDVAVAVPDDEAAEGFVRSLAATGWRAAAVVDQVEACRLATVRLVPPGGHPRRFVADVLFASSGLESEIVASAEHLEVLPGVVVPTALAGHLIALKVLARDDARRPQDRGDALALLRGATPQELELARASVRLIEERGFQREKNLRAELEALVRDAAAGSDDSGSRDG